MEELKSDERLRQTLETFSEGPRCWAGKAATRISVTRYNHQQIVEAKKTRQRLPTCQSSKATPQRQWVSLRRAEGSFGLGRCREFLSKLRQGAPPVIFGGRLPDSISIVPKGRRDVVSITGHAVEARTDDLVHLSKSRPFLQVIYRTIGSLV